MSHWLEHTELIGPSFGGGHGGGGFHGGGGGGGGFGGYHGGGGGGGGFRSGGFGGYHRGAMHGVGPARMGHYGGAHGRFGPSTATRFGHYTGAGHGRAGFGRRTGGFRDRFGFGWGFYMPFFWFNIYSLAVLSEMALIYNWRLMQDGRYYDEGGGGGGYLEPYQMQYALAAASAQADERINQHSSQEEVQGKVRQFLPEHVRRARQLTQEEYKALAQK